MVLRVQAASTAVTAMAALASPARQGDMSIQEAPSCCRVAGDGDVDVRSPQLLHSGGIRLRGDKELISMARSRSSTSSVASNNMDRGKQIETGLVDFLPHPPSRLDAYAYLEEPMEMTFGKFHFRVEKEGAYRLEVPISSGLSAVDPDFSSSASSIELGDEEISSPRFIGTKASEKLAKIFSNMSFESSADSYISDDSSDTDSFDFIDKSISIGKVFTNLYDGVTKPSEVQNSKYHQIYAIGETSRNQEETSEAFDELGNPYVDPSDLRRVNDSMVAYKEMYNELEKLFDGCEWGLDMVGKLHKALPGGYEYMLVAVDKFTKWIEAKPINSPDAASAIKFVKGIVFRFGVPHSIVTDNGSNFTSKEFKVYCAEVGIKLHFASVAHPQTNGQVEKANGIKKRLLGPLEKARHTWPEELPSVLWSIRTTPNTATQETPFFWSMEQKVLPIEIEHDSPRVTEYNEEVSRKALEDDVDALDEARDEVLSRVTKYQQDLKNYHSRRLRPRSFQVGDLVLRLNQERTEKLESPWLGPYVVTEVIEGGAYRIKDKKTGNPEKNPWNVAQLRCFYA
ncbi:hypothetical protein QYE76_036607 [Lolium multiflorum]|uniref:Integrase catalytic domain-containing protein n=1 Tax=Lolium multiflorum TaxID=4521 RepID=A0AAD8VN87_LOLMU|nr:hypothetical protein QYE76_036607 [Lolium multiflorum]